MPDQREPSPAPGEDISSALALVNTRHMHTDLLADGARAGEWLAAHGFIPDGTRLAAPEAARLRALREATRALLSARAAGRIAAAGNVSVLNAALAAAPVIPALTWDDAGPHRSELLLATLTAGPPQRQAADPFCAALARLAADALRVLTDSRGPQPAPCAAHGCIRWFLRTHGARQWCSARCGDRVRAARHYARHHQGTADQPTSPGARRPGRPAGPG